MAHLVLTSIVTDADWDTDSPAALAAAHGALHAHARRRGLIVHGRPEEDVQFLEGSHRVRITLTAEGVTSPPTDLPLQETAPPPH